MLTQLKKDFPQDLRVAYRHFPLINIHPNAALSMQAADAAGTQGKFWPMHDLLYERQDEWANLESDAFLAWLEDLAVELDLDTERFSEEITSEASKTSSQAAWDFGVEVGIPGTPFLVINDQPYGGPLDYGNLTTIVKLYVLSERQYTACPPMAIDPARDYVATIQTEKGDLVVQLFPDKAPLAVNSFVFLAREGWFDGVTFHRVLPGFVAQAGDPSGTGFGGPGYAFENEIAPDLRFDKRGVLGMANAGPDSNGSQFFITYAAQPDLDGQYTIFGEVLTGFDTLENLTIRDPRSNPDMPPGDRILTISIEEK